MEILANWNPQISYAAGWTGIFLSFFTGMILGLVVKKDERFGGYSSIARRYFRLGHIALAALGMINLLGAVSMKVGFPVPPLSLALLLVGLITMPIACAVHALSGKGYYVFPIPSLSLSGAVALMIFNF